MRSIYIPQSMESQRVRHDWAHMYAGIFLKAHKSVKKRHRLISTFNSSTWTDYSQKKKFERPRTSRKIKILNFINNRGMQNKIIKKCVQSCLSLVTPCTVAYQAPLSMDFPRQGYLQGIFPTQGSNSSLLRWQVDSLLLSHQESI